jgi:hypothetical protein
MSTVQEIEAAIEKLSREDFDRLRTWMIERDHDAWDREIEADSLAGRLDSVVEEAMSDYYHRRNRGGS